MAKRKINKGKIALLILAIITNILTIYSTIKIINYISVLSLIIVLVIGFVIFFALFSNILLMVSVRSKRTISYYCSWFFMLILTLLSSAIIFASNYGDSLISNMITSNDKVEISYSYLSFDSNLSSLQDLTDKRVGMISNYQSNSYTDLAYKKIFSINSSVETYQYSDLNECFNGMVNNEVDVMIAPTSYQSILGSYYDLSNVHQVASFTEELVSKQENKNVTLQTFNILLIGFAPNDSYGNGLADTIISTSFNPLTKELSMVSIPRDTYDYQWTKINHSRASSREDLIEACDNLLGFSHDYYVEVNFKSIVSIVDAIGGIDLVSPVSFRAQDSSDVRNGIYSLYIPQGEFHADGELALAFARERYAMPNGDFDRQVNQQTVIKTIIAKVFSNSSVSSMLNLLNIVSENIKTNIPLTTISDIALYLLDSCDGLSASDDLRIKSSRLTGYFYTTEIGLSTIRISEESLDFNRALLNGTINGDYREDNLMFTFDYREGYSSVVEYPE